MAQSACAKCGSQIFLGEVQCASCGAPTPEEVATFGKDVDHGGRTPPPEGLNLIVQKGVADYQARDRNRERAESSRYPTSEGGLAMAAGKGLVGMSKVERDQDGKVIWDPKHAIIGLLVIMIFIALIIGYFYLQYRYRVAPYTQTSQYSTFGE